MFAAAFLQKFIWVNMWPTFKCLQKKEMDVGVSISTPRASGRWFEEILMTQNRKAVGVLQRRSGFSSFHTSSVSQNNTAHVIILKLSKGSAFKTEKQSVRTKHKSNYIIPGGREVR